MAARQYYSASNAGPVNNTSNSTWADIVQLPDFEPDASSTYAFFWSSALQNATNTSADAQLRVRFGPAGFETTIATLNLESAAITEYPQLAGMFFHVEGITPIDVYADVAIKAETNTNSINAKNGQIVALKLGANDVAAESLTRQTTTSTTPADAVTANFTSDGGDYVVVGYGEFDINVGTVPVYIRLRCEGTNTGELGVRSNDASNLIPGLMVWRFTSVPAGARSAGFQFRSHNGTTTSGITNARILVMRAADFDAVYGDQLSSNSTGTQSDAVAMTFTDTLTANPHLLLGGWGTSGTTTSTLITSQLTEAGSDIAESIRRTYSAAAVRFHNNAFASVRTPGSGSTTYTLDRVQAGSTSITVGAGSGLALIDLGASSAGITGSASGTLLLSGAASGTLQVAATASGFLPLTGSATSTAHIAGTASGTLPLTGGAAGTVGSAISGSAGGTLPLTGGATGKATISATAGGTLQLAGSSATTVRLAGSASGTLPLTGSATGTERIAASAAGSFALVGSAAATARIAGTAAGSFPLTGSAAGTALTGIVGSAAGTFPLTGAAIGALRIVAAASGALPLAGSSIGTARLAGDASGILPLSGESSSTISVTATASGLLDLTGESSGTTATFGQASGDLPLTGEAVGTVRVRGTVSGSLGLSGSSAALARNTASAAGALPLTGSSSARLVVSGSAAGLLGLTGSADAAVAVFGRATGDFPLTGSAAGMISTPVPIPAPRIITLTAQRTVITPDTVDTVIRPVALQTVLTPPAQPVILTPPHRCCVIILAGYEEVDMSSEYFNWPDKLAPAVIFYGVDWARRLGEATIVSHNFELVSGSVTLTPRAPNGTETSVEIAGGTAGSIAVIIASAVASDGETHAIRVSIDIA